MNLLLHLIIDMEPREARRTLNILEEERPMRAASARHSQSQVQAIALDGRFRAWIVIRVF